VRERKGVKKMMKLQLDNNNNGGEKIHPCVGGGSFDARAAILGEKNLEGPSKKESFTPKK